MKNTVKRILCFILSALLLCTSVAVGAENVEEAVDVGDNYVYYGQYMADGAGEYTLSELYDYTIFAYAPTETGKYTFACSNGLIGIVSYNGMWITIQPSDTTVTESSVEWECTGVGQEIWVAIISDDAAASVEITRGESETVVVERIEYVNKTTPVEFTFEGDSAALLNVNTLNSTVDTAVLGADGYYHLNSATGYILYANLSDSEMNLYAASGYGQLKGAVRDENGNVVSITDYNNAFLEYYDCRDTATNLYPLTDDLIEIFKECGDNLGWYGEGGWLGLTKDDAWMFACYYLETASFTVTINGVETAVEAGTTIDLSAEAFYSESNRYYRFTGWTGDVDGIADAAAAATTVTVNGDLTIDAGYIIVGDITGDGNINAADSNTMRRMAAGQVEANASGDVDGDGKVLPNDSNLLGRMIGGSWFPTK